MVRCWQAISKRPTWSAEHTRGPVGRSSNGADCTRSGVQLHESAEQSTLQHSSQQQESRRRALSEYRNRKTFYRPTCFTERLRGDCPRLATTVSSPAEKVAKTWARVSRGCRVIPACGLISARCGSRARIRTCHNRDSLMFENLRRTPIRARENQKDDFRDLESSVQAARRLARCVRHGFEHYFNIRIRNTVM